MIVTPVLAATVIGISRIQDNRHHWEGTCGVYKRIKNCGEKRRIIALTM